MCKEHSLCKIRLTSMAVLAGCLAILTFSTQAQAEDVSLGWAGQMGGIVADFGNATAVDGLGNVYTTGTFEGLRTGACRSGCCKSCPRVN